MSYEYDYNVRPKRHALKYALTHREIKALRPSTNLTLEELEKAGILDLL